MKNLSLLIIVLYSNFAFAEISTEELVERSIYSCQYMAPPKSLSRAVSVVCNKGAANGFDFDLVDVPPSEMQNITVEMNSFATTEYFKDVDIYIKGTNSVYDRGYHSFVEMAKVLGIQSSFPVGYGSTYSTMKILCGPKLIGPEFFGSISLSMLRGEKEGGLILAHSLIPGDTQQNTNRAKLQCKEVKRWSEPASQVKRFTYDPINLGVIVNP